MSALGTDGIHPYDRPLWDVYRFDKSGVFPTMFNDPATLREYTDRWRADGVWFEVVQVREAKGTALALAEVPRG